MLKVKDVYQEALKEVTWNLQKVLDESLKSIKKVHKALESVWKSSPAKKPVLCRNQLSNPLGK